MLIIIIDKFTDANVSDIEANMHEEALHKIAANLAWGQDQDLHQDTMSATTTNFLSI